MSEELLAKTRSLIDGLETDESILARLFFFVRDEIQFNWIYPQDVSPETVLSQGVGVCMQKANLLGSLAREAGYGTRFKFLYVKKQALEDFLPAFAYANWPDPFPHTVTEIKRGDTWTSFDVAFDRALYDICLRHKLNFAKYPNILDQCSLAFSPEGVKGAQEYWAVSDVRPFYGDDLSPLFAFERGLSPLKRLLKPMIFSKARKIVLRLREECRCR
jgi:hypothetical protein